MAREINFPIGDYELLRIHWDKEGFEALEEFIQDNSLT